MTDLHLPVPDPAAQPLEFLDAVLDPADLLPGTLIALIATAEGDTCVNIVSDGAPAPLPAADPRVLHGFAVAAEELHGRLGLILCRDGLPGVTEADRAWARVLADCCARDGLSSLGVLAHTSDGTVRVA